MSGHDGARHDTVRAAQRAAWSGLSAGWEKWDADIMSQLAPVAAAMIDRLAPDEDQVHLDLAAGTGEPGLSIAALAPRGHVVLTDLAGPMLDAAGRRARARGITNVGASVCSADALPFAEAAFDSVSMRFGYMFLPDLAAATAEIVRVLRPGGQVCASVWGSAEQNPWTTIATRAVAAETGIAPSAPHPDRPHIFRCAEPGLVSGLYESAGLDAVAEWDVAVELVTATPAAYWQVVSEHVAPVVAALEEADPAARVRIEESVLAAVARYEVGGAVRVPGLARCVAGTAKGA